MSQNVPTSVMNQRILESLAQGDVKKAADASSAFTRTQLREESFAFKILPPQQATDDMLVPTLNQDSTLQVYWELEPDAPGAKWVPFQTIPEGEYMQGSRYIIPMARIVTPSFKKDLDELRTYKSDLRKIFTDNSIKDGLAEIDTKFISLVDGIVTDTTGGLTDQAQVFTGKVQWRTFTGGLTRANLAEAKKMLPEGSTFTGMGNKFRLRNYCCLMNDVTAQELLKYTRNQAGGDLSETMLKDGLVMDKIMGMKVIYTIKGAQVPNGRVYFFAAPEFLGKTFYMTDWTMFMRKEAFLLEMFSYWLGGMAIGNVAGVARADFTGI